MDRSTLAALIDKALEESNEANPRVIADRLVNQLATSELRDVLAITLHHEVKQRVRNHRQTQGRPPVQSSKWRTAVDDVLRERYWTKDGWVFLGECTPSQVQSIVSGYYLRAAQNEAAGDRFLELHQVMLQAGVSKVADLGADRVAALIHVEYAELLTQETDQGSSDTQRSAVGDQ